MDAAEVNSGVNGHPRRRRGRPLRDPALAGLSADERRARYRQEERVCVLAAFEALHDADSVAASLGLTTDELGRRIERLSLCRAVARLLAPEKRPRTDYRPCQSVALGPSAGAVTVRRREGHSELPAALATPQVSEGEPAPPQTHSTAASPATPVGVGRFVAGPAARREPATLDAPGGAAELWQIVEAYRGNRRAIVRRLGELYDWPAGRAPDDADLDRMLATHGLTERFRAREAENVRFLYGFHKGAHAKVAQALLVSPADLEALVARLGMAAELEALRERQRTWVRERMPPGEKLKLVLTREKYLADLGTLAEVDRDVEVFVREAFRRHAANAPAASAVEERVRRDLGLDLEGMRRLLRRYRLFTLARTLIAAPFATELEPRTSNVQELR